MNLLPVVVLKTKICQASNELKDYISHIVKFEKRKLHSSFMDNIWAADLADMQLIGKCNNGFLFFVMCY